MTTDRVEVNPMAVKLRRSAKGLSQQQLCDGLKGATVDRATLSRIEAGKVQPTRAVARAIANALRCSVKALSESPL